LQLAELALQAENRLQRQRAAAGRVEGARADFAGKQGWAERRKCRVEGEGEGFFRDQSIEFKFEFEFKQS
jgi:hypothetical protein